MLKELIDRIVGFLARKIHPDQDRVALDDAALWTDIGEEKVAEALDDIAAGDTQLQGWRVSATDLVKLAYHDEPDRDQRASLEGRAKLWSDNPDLSKSGEKYVGTASQNVRLHGAIFRAIEQRGIKLPKT